MEALTNIEGSLNAVQSDVRKFYFKMTEKKIDDSKVSWISDLNKVLIKTIESFVHLKKPLIDLNAGSLKSIGITLRQFNDISSTDTILNELTIFFVRFSQINVPCDTLKKIVYKHQKSLLKDNERILATKKVCALIRLFSRNIGFTEIDVDIRKSLSDNAKRIHQDISVVTSGLAHSTSLVETSLTEIRREVKHIVDWIGELNIMLTTRNRSNARTVLTKVRTSLGILTKTFQNRKWLEDIKFHVRGVLDSMDSLVELHQNLRFNIGNLLPLPYQEPSFYIINELERKSIDIRLNSIVKGVDNFLENDFVAVEPWKKLWIQYLRDLTVGNALVLEPFKERIAVFDRKFISYFNALLKSFKKTKRETKIISQANNYLNHFQSVQMTVRLIEKRGETIYHTQILTAYKDCILAMTKDQANKLAEEIRKMFETVEKSNEAIMKSTKLLRDALNVETLRTGTIFQEINKLKSLIVDEKASKNKQKILKIVEDIKKEIDKGIKNFQTQNGNLKKYIDNIKANIQTGNDIQCNLRQTIENYLSIKYSN